MNNGEVDQMLLVCANVTLAAIVDGDCCTIGKPWELGMNEFGDTRSSAGHTVH